MIRKFLVENLKKFDEYKRKKIIQITHSKFLAVLNIANNFN